MKKQSQNKPNLLDAQMNVSSILTKDYGRNDIFAVPENKANSNPNKANFRKAKMNISSLITKDYRKKDDFAVQKNKANSNPICQRVKLMQSVYLQRIMKKNAAKGYEKTKPKQTQFAGCSNERKLCFNKGL